MKFTLETEDGPKKTISDVGDSNILINEIEHLNEKGNSWLILEPECPINGCRFIQAFIDEEEYTVELKTGDDDSDIRQLCTDSMEKVKEIFLDFFTSHKLPDLNEDEIEVNYIIEKAEKTEKFFDFIQKLIEKNGEDILGSRIYCGEDITDKILLNATNRLQIPSEEDIFLLFDNTVFGSCKEGMAFTNWGIRYNNGSDWWMLSWVSLAKDYIISKTEEPDKLLFRHKTRDNETMNKLIDIPFACDNFNILTQLLNGTCLIFTEKSIEIGSIEKIQTIKSTGDDKEKTNKTPPPHAVHQAFCGNCGAKVGGSEKYCGSCGNALNH